MATEVPVRDERDEVQIEETKVDVDIKNVHEVSVSQPKNVEGAHEEEEVKVEGSQDVEVSITESEKKPEDKEKDPMVEQVKTEEDDDKSTVKQSVEVEVENKVNASDTPEPPTEVVESPAGDTEASKMEEQEPEAEKEPTLRETKAKENEDVQKSPVVSAAPSSTSVESLTASTMLESAPDATIITSAEVSELKGVQEGALVPDVTETKDFDPNSGTGKEESMEESGSAVIKVEAVDTNIEEDKQEKTMEFEKPTLSEKTQTEDPTEVVEISGQEKASRDIEVVEEKKGGSFEADSATLVETTADLDVVGGESNINTSIRELEGDSKEAKSELNPAEAIQTTTIEGSEDKKEENIKADEQSLVEPTKVSGETKTDVEAPQQEVIAKTSQHQSNNILSKMKQSIVKVKKAIIGKSPSSKTMSSKGKDESKEK